MKDLTTTNGVLEWAAGAAPTKEPPDAIGPLTAGQRAAYDRKYARDAARAAKLARGQRALAVLEAFEAEYAKSYPVVSPGSLRASLRAAMDAEDGGER